MILKKQLTRIDPLSPLSTHFPPVHPFESGSIGIGTGNPVLEEFEMGGETLKDFWVIGSKGWAVGVGDEVMDGEEVAPGFEPTKDGLEVGIALGGMDGAVEGVLEDPVEGLFRGVGEEIAETILTVEFEGGSFVASANGRGGEVESENVGLRGRPGANIVAESATRD